MPIIFFYLFIITSVQLTADPSEKIVTFTKRIVLEKFPEAFNPSLIRFNENFLLTFRYCPNRYYQPWLAYIGVVLLNDLLEPISEPVLLNSRVGNSNTPSQSEDARVFSFQGKLYLIFNDSLDVFFPQTYDRRDMYMAELTYENGQFSLSPPLKLIYEEKYHTQNWQKNWVPFEWNNILLMSYSINPHEVIYPNLINGFCYRCYDSRPNIKWDYGTLRGSTPPLLLDGEYFAFFHSGIPNISKASYGQPMWHYYMGAYTFSASPPFQITKMTPEPIIAEGFYTQSRYEKRVIFPGGCVISGDRIYVAYGKDDYELWIAIIDKKALMKTMITVK